MLMKYTIKSIIIITVIIILFTILINYNMLIFPIDPNIYNKKSISLSMFITNEFKISYDLAQSIVKISELEGMDPFLITALILTESSFNENVVSSKGYIGLMQVDKDLKYRDVNILYGIKILKEKLYETNGNLFKAIIYYKGYKNNEYKGAKEAEKVLSYFSYMKNKFYKGGKI